MANDQNLTPFQPGHSGNPEGRPKGSQNRNTIARKILALMVNIPPKQFAKWKEIWPELSEQVTGEEMITLAAEYRAIKRDNAYKILMDSAYGAPKQEVDMTSDGERINPVVTLHVTGHVISTSEKDVKLD